MPAEVSSRGRCVVRVTASGDRTFSDVTNSSVSSIFDRM